MPFALDRIAPGDHVLLHSACAEPQTLVEGLVEGIRARRPNLRDLTLISLTYRTGGAAAPPYADLDLLRDRLLRFKTFFPVAALKQAAREGLIDYVPVSFANLPGLIRAGIFRPDVALMQVSPPNEQGHCSFGAAGAMVPALLKTDVSIIAEMNRKSPFTYGVQAPVERFAAVVESNRELIEAQPSVLGSIERKVAANVAELVPDGATVQLGVGSVPEAVMEQLAHRRNLGLWGSALADGAVDLIRCGAVTNLNRSFDRGMTVASILLGTRRLFDFVHRNRLVELRDLDHCNSPIAISKIRGLISINSALEVDYEGQVNSEILGAMPVAGAGSVTDYVSGVWHAEDALSIIALPSATPSGRPRIVPRLAQGTPVTLPRQMVQIVITDKGIADLRGKSLSERAQLLKSIA
ncbi:MAG: acetyl-CoA hydrolase/transferase family protein [Burkholderiales bacterium]|nr:acetyl-CoA hydrolase/transferase family protein [Burkholderiales bacterium]